MTQAHRHGLAAPRAALLALLLVAGAGASAQARSGADRQAASAFESELGAAIAELARTRLGLADASIDVTRVELPETIAPGTRLGPVELASKGRPSGWVTARVQLVTAAGERDMWVKAKIDVRVPTLVATRPLARGTLISERDVRVEARLLSDDRLALAAPAIGSKLRRALETGEALDLRGLERPVLVKRGDTVTATVSGDRFALSAPAEALEDAALGDEIALRVKLGQKKVVRGVVIDSRHVELR